MKDIYKSVCNNTIYVYIQHIGASEFVFPLSNYNFVSHLNITGLQQTKIKKTNLAYYRDSVDSLSHRAYTRNAIQTFLIITIIYI